MSEAIEALKNYMSAEVQAKVNEVLGDALDISPSGLAQRALGDAIQLSDIKATVATGIDSFKSRFKLPKGRIDGLGTPDLGAMKDKADALKAKAAEAIETVGDFKVDFPEYALDPDIINFEGTIGGIDTNLSEYSIIDSDKLNEEIAEADAEVSAQTLLQGNAQEFKNIFS